jgi:receptor expression-enhancing protein 5/6
LVDFSLIQLIHVGLYFFQLTKYPILNQFEQRTQVPKTYAVLGTVTLLTLLIFINPLAAPISNLIGWGFPAYLSFKALETPQHQDDMQWLTYWIVFGFFTFLESFALRLVLYYFPFYFAFKTVFVIWLQLPAFKVSFDVILCDVNSEYLWTMTGCY